MKPSIEPTPAFPGMRTTHVVRDATGRLLSYIVSRERPPTAAELDAIERRDRAALSEARTARLQWLARATPTPRADANRRRLASVR